MATVGVSKLFYGSPIVVILGATGTGKSKLAIQIAKRFKGEIISADAMQMYKGLDIATNKVTAEEQNEIPHHLLGFLDPRKVVTVYEFRDIALAKMKDIFDRQKLPVIVGGTNYYIESILYELLVSPPSPGTEDEDLPRKKLKADYEEALAELEKLDNEKLHAKLMEVDPEKGKTLHPNDRRKILRSIGVFLQFGEKLSTLLERQRSLPGGCQTGGPLRFTDSIVLWLQCDPEVLNHRLDSRVDEMLAQGLVDELLRFHKQYNTRNLVDKDPDYTRGIFQSIGLKEFHEYLVMSEEERASDEGKKELEKGVNMLKISTRQYAKSQGRWILNRFLKNAKRQVPPIYALDATDISRWDEKVFAAAEHIVESRLAGRIPSAEPLPLEDTKVVVDQIYRCDVCEKVLMGKSQWETHLRGRKHAITAKRKKRLLLQQQEQQPPPPQEQPQQQQ